MNDMCRITATRGTEVTTVDVAGFRSDLLDILTAIMASLLTQDCIYIGDLLDAVSRAEDIADRRS